MRQHAATILIATCAALFAAGVQGQTTGRVLTGPQPRSVSPEPTVNGLGPYTGTNAAGGATPNGVGIPPAWVSAPGNYGTAYGYPAFGYPRTYTTFSSPYGGGYGYGYEPYGYVSNRYGVGLWRPGYTVPGYSYRSSYYWTYAPAPIRPPVPAAFPPMGVYAPGFGPGAFYGR